MLRIQCPSCASVYELPAASVGPGGRKVRCAACKTSWLVEPQEVSPAPSEAAAANPQHDANAQPVEPPPAPVDPGPMPAARPKAPWYERFSPRPQARRFGFGAPLLACLAILAVAAAGIGLRASIVSAFPQTGALYAALGVPVNLRGLELRAVRSALLAEGGADMLVVQGEIVSVSRQRLPLPRLHFSIRDAKGVVIYSWTAQADAKDIAPGGALAFRRRLASPPPESHDVMVRFASKADLIAAR